MTKIQKLTLGIIFTFFSINMLGCSDSETTISGSPAIQVSPALDFDFGTVTEGNTALLKATITNVGSERLDISSISLNDDLPGTINFQLDPNGGINPCINLSTALPAGENCTVEITFTPEQFNTLSTDPALPLELGLATELEINSNDPSTPNKILNLAGTSKQVSSELTVTINQVDTTTCDAVAYVSVTDQSGFPVEGLELLATNFTITEDVDGAIIVSSPISSTVGIAVEPISIALVMDNSGSMQDDIAEMNQAALNIVDAVEQRNSTDKLEIIKFDKAVKVMQTFTNEYNRLRDAIEEPFGVSGTALYDAAQQAILDIKSQLTLTERKAIIIITDGEDTESATATLGGIIDEAKAGDIPIFVIALGSVNQKTLDEVLKKIATDTSGEFYQADVVHNFSTIIEQQLTEVLFTDQYILTYTSGSSGGTDVNLAIEIDVDNLGTTTGSDNKSVTSCP